MIPAKHKPFDSSKTRVVPVFNALSKGNNAKLREFLAFIAEHVTPITRCASKIQASALKEYSTIKIHYGKRNGKTDGVTVEPGEKRIAPRFEFLEWLILNAKTAKSEVGERAKLFSRDKKTQDAARKEALSLLRKHWNKNHVPKSWYILEGDTSPDVYIETDQYILVIEAKRTEPTLTDKTKWMKQRNQMVRHLHPLFADKSSHRPAYGLYIISRSAEEDPAFKIRKFPNHAAACEKEYSDERTWLDSAPDLGRTALNMRTMLLGYITWEEIIERFPEIGKYPYCVMEDGSLGYL